LLTSLIPVRLQQGKEAGRLGGWEAGRRGGREAGRQGGEEEAGRRKEAWGRVMT
jgi:hypothetical protein